MFLKRNKKLKMAKVDSCCQITVGKNIEWVGKPIKKIKKKEQVFDYRTSFFTIDEKGVPVLNLGVGKLVAKPNGFLVGTIQYKRFPSIIKSSNITKSGLVVAEIHDGVIKYAIIPQKHEEPVSVHQTVANHFHGFGGQVVKESHFNGRDILLMQNNCESEIHSSNTEIRNSKVSALQVEQKIRLIYSLSDHTSRDIFEAANENGILSQLPTLKQEQLISNPSRWSRSTSYKQNEEDFVL